MNEKKLNLKEKKLKNRKICNLVLLVLCVAFIAPQFIKEYEYVFKNELHQHSTMQLLWLSANNVLTNFIKAGYNLSGKITVNPYVNGLVIPVFLIVAEIIFTVINPKGGFIQWLALSWGLVGVFCNINNKLFALGTLGNTWLQPVLIIVSALAAVIAILEFVFFTNYKRD